MFFLGWIAFSLLAGFIGSDRECGFGKPFLISLFLTPVIGLIYVFSVTKNSTVDFQNRMMGKSNVSTQWQIKPLMPNTNNSNEASSKSINILFIVLIVIAAILIINNALQQ